MGVGNGSPGKRKMTIYRHATASETLVLAYVAAAEASGDPEHMFRARGARRAEAEGRLDVRRTAANMQLLAQSLCDAAAEA